MSLSEVSALQFSLNRIVAPRLSLEAFARLCRRLDVRIVELRNDLRGVEMADGTPAEQVRDVVGAAGLTIRSINALQRFDRFDDARRAEAITLARYAHACGAQALVLCPTNSHDDARSSAERHHDLVHALRELKLILEDHGLEGLIEPLGFGQCALRRKSVAVRAIEAARGEGRLRLVHDTFHHHVAGEGRFFARWTGLVHISGVEDPALCAGQMQDADRVLIGETDRLGNVRQLRALLDGGYDSCVSFEPFAEEIAAAEDIEHRLRHSMDYLRREVALVSV
ncbi:TIM barrel protein [Ralstonia solanacearum]|uniref:TIM barrel protein n=1 Tax=Ralstonia solanacearum TaxID=305 RepID=UPI0018D1C20C|nr:TIM barrel protein [Ralstonia solanacearum]